MELRQLRYFVAIAEELHFTRAAARVGIAQPPFSMAIRALENEVGATLLDRSRRGARLTDAGRAFLAEARRSLDAASRATTDAQRAAAGEIGELRLAFAASTLFSAAFRDGVRAYRAQHPHVRLELRQMFSQRTIERIVDDEVDVAFMRVTGERGATALPQRIGSLHVLTEPLVAIVPHDHRLARGRRAIAIDALADDDFVTYVPGIGSGTLDIVTTLFAASGRSPHVVQEAREPHTILGLVSAGIGVSIMPQSICELRARDVVARPLTPRVDTDVLLVWDEERPSALRERFVDVIARSSRAG